MPGYRGLVFPLAPGPCQATGAGLATLALAGPKRPGPRSASKRGLPRLLLASCARGGWALALGMQILPRARQALRARPGAGDKVEKPRGPPAPKTRDPEEKIRSGAPAESTFGGSFLARLPNQEGLQAGPD